MIQICNVKISEVQDLQNIARTTFVETFGEFNSQENIHAYIAERLSISQLEQEINNPESAFYFAYFNNELAGYLKLNEGSAQTEFMNDETLEIERIYILNAFQGMKVGAALMNKAIETAISKNKNSIWLGVWEKNAKAIDFYLNFGFVKTSEHIFVLGDDAQTDFILSMKLNN